jgi:septum formation protein
LRKLCLSFEVEAPNADETQLAGESPRDFVKRLAGLKGAAVASRHPGAMVLAADTAVVLEQEILGKPASAKQAREMLARLSGRTHAVLTGLVLVAANGGAGIAETKVAFRRLSPEEIDWYVSTGEPMDKAGAYALQEVGGFLVEAIHGSHSNVIGLPLAEALVLLERAGYPLPWRKQ